MTALATAYVRLRVDGSQLPGDVKRSMTTAGSGATAAGKSAGSKFSSSFGRTTVAGAKTAGVGIDRALLAGAVTSGSGYGKRFGIAMRGTVADYAKGTGAALVGFFAFAKVKEALTFAISEGREAQKVSAQTTSAIAATGGAANVTAEQINDLSAALSRKAGIDDEVIQSGANVLLTFRNVRNEAGRGNDVFDQGLSLALDLSVAMGTDLRSASLQLGKALNDPVRGMTALTRAGVTFDDQQRAQITRLQESGDMLGAQRIILRELAAEFEGSARAQRTAGDQLSVSYANVAESLGTKLLPKLDEFESWLATDGLTAVTTLGRAVDDDLLQPLGKVAGVVGDVLGVIDDLPSGFKASVVEVGLLALGVKLFLSLGAAAGIARISTAVTTLGIQTQVTRELQAAGISTMRLYGAQALTAGKNLLTGRAGALGLAVGLQTLDSAVGDSNQTLHSFLTVASSAAAGFAVGGPWGAAIGGGIGLLQVFGDSHKSAAADVESLTQSLNEQTGAVTANTARLVANSLATSGAVEQANTLGISSRELIGALLEGGDAYDALIAKVEAYDGSLNSSGSAAGKYTSQQVDQIYAAKQLLDILGDTNGNLSESQQKWLLQQQAEKAAAGAIKDNNNALGDQATKLHQATAALAGYNQKASDFFGRQISLHQAILDATKAEKEQANGFRLGTQAGLDNRNVIKQLADSTQGYTARTERGRRAIELAAEKIITFAHAQGASIPQAKAYAERLLDISAASIDIDKHGNPHVHVTVDTGDGVAKLTAFQRLLATLHSKQITVEATFLRHGQPIPGTGKGAIFMASGGLRKPMVSGQPILWGEAGPEAYIPLVGPSDPRHPRAVDLLGETAKALGARSLAAGDVFHIGGIPQLPDQWAQIRDLLQALRSGDVKDDRRDSLLGKIHDTADKMRGEVKDELQDARGNLRDLLQSQRQLEASIGSQFQTANVYGEGAPSTARDLFMRARAQVNDAKLFQHVLRRLKAKGANPALLRALAEAGPGAIVQAQAFAGMSERELNRYERLVGAGNRAAGGIGDFIGRQVFGGRIRDARQEVHEMRRAFEQLDHRLDQLPDKVGKATAKALDGTAVKMDGRKVGELVGSRHDRIDRGG